MTSVETPGTGTSREVEVLDEAVIRFAGDSGDGMQLTGTQFTNTAALLGNDLATFPDYPAEIRAPAGTLPGVSAFQIRFSNFDIHTPGDKPDVLVAMNPASLKVHLDELKRGGVLIVNTGMFRAKEIKMAGFEVNPLEDEKLSLSQHYRLISVDLNQLTNETLKESPLDARGKMRCKNMAALGILFWLYNRPLEPTIEEIQAKFGKKPEIAEANISVLKAGYHYGETAELLQHTYRVDKAELPSGIYRNINGNDATAYGMVAASKLAGVPLFLGSYPITPASDILHFLSGMKSEGVVTFQAEDEIAGICSAIGAAWAGNLAVTTSSGPGIALKGEAIGLAVMTELPLVIVNVQRGGPSTGLPTKTEQADLFQAIYGRNGECPLPVLAAATPSDCFNMVIEAFRIATKHMIPVMLLTDGYLANGSEPWRLPEVADLPRIDVRFAGPADLEDGHFLPYKRGADSLARPWAKPGTPGLEHRIGGLEKADITGNVSYDPDNHFHMVRLRQEKVDRIADDIVEPELFGEQSGGLVVVGWGSTYGAICGGVNQARRRGLKVSRLHLRHLNPLPKSLGDTLRRFDKVLVPEMNLGQLATVLRSRFQDIRFEQLNKVNGRPFSNTEIREKIEEVLA
ncbi:MAG: 2-oxoacid:acceptor oxidoreductase subunit alpha [Planctomycetota bacterium]